jgi:hypothetical protein
MTKAFGIGRKEKVQNDVALIRRSLEGTVPPYYLHWDTELVSDLP